MSSTSSPFFLFAIWFRWAASLALAVGLMAGDPEGARAQLGSGGSCVILHEGSLKCWGRNSDGQLGLGDTENRGDNAGEMGDNLPAVNLGTDDQGNPLSATQVDAGYEHTCALLNDGNVKCWGSNQQGELGLGDTEARGDEPGEMGDNLPAVNLGTDDQGNPLSATQVAVGNWHTCAVLENGSLRCWGRNNSGELGLGDTENRGDNAGEMGGNLATVNLGTDDQGNPLSATQVTPGYDHTCAVLDNDVLKCWGDNNAGELGLGHSEARGDESGEMGDNLPAVDLGTDDQGNPLSATQVAVGGYTCARMDADGDTGDPIAAGEIKCWGPNDSGQLGLGDTEPRGDASGEMGDNLPAVNLGGTALPVELTGFTARMRDSETVVLTWQTASETGNTGFEIQRRVRDTKEASWTKVDFVESKAPGGTTPEARSYQFTDRNMPYEVDRLTYRLRQIDTDGSTRYSKEITVKRGVTEIQLMGTFPNPSSQRFTIRYALPKPQEITLQLYDLLGREVRTLVQGKQGGRHKTTVDVSSLPSGTYFLQLRTGSQTRTRKVTVMR